MKYSYCFGAASVDIVDIVGLHSLIHMRHTTSHTHTTICPPPAQSENRSVPWHQPTGKQHVYIRDPHQNVIARIDEGTANKYIYDIQGNLLASYKKSVHLSSTSPGALV